MKQLSEHRLKQYEKLIRRLRQLVFTNDRAHTLLLRVKTKCANNWQARHLEVKNKLADKMLNVYFL